MCSEDLAHRLTNTCEVYTSLCVNFYISIQKFQKASIGFLRCWCQQGSWFCWFARHNSLWFIVIFSQQSQICSLKAVCCIISQNTQRITDVFCNVNCFFMHSGAFKVIWGQISNIRPRSSLNSSFRRCFLTANTFPEWAHFFPLWNRLTGQRSRFLRATALTVNVYLVSTVSIQSSGQRRWKPSWMSEWRLDLVAGPTTLALPTKVDSWAAVSCLHSKGNITLLL